MFGTGWMSVFAAVAAIESAKQMVGYLDDLHCEALDDEATWELDVLGWAGQEITAYLERTTYLDVLGVDRV